MMGVILGTINLQEVLNVVWGGLGRPIPIVKLHIYDLYYLFIGGTSLVPRFWLTVQDADNKDVNIPTFYIYVVSEGQEIQLAFTSCGSATIAFSTLEKYLPREESPFPPCLKFYATLQ